MHNYAAHSRELDKLAELRAFEQSLLSRTGPTRIIPARQDQLEPPQVDDETGESAETTATPTTTGPDIENVTADLVRGIATPGPAVIAVARQAAEAMRSAWAYNRAIDGTLATVNTGGDGNGILATVERLTRLRDAEVLVMGRLLLALEMLRGHELQVEARVVARTDRARASRRR